MCRRLPVLFIALACTGCGGVRESAEAVAGAPSSILVGKADQTAAVAAREARLGKAACDIADIFVNQVEAAFGTALTRTAGHEHRLELQRARLSLATRMWTLATAENAELALLGVTGMTRLVRQVIDGRLQAGQPIAEPQLLQAAARRAEEAAWALAREQLGEERLEALSQAVARWWVRNPEPQAVFSLELRDLVSDEGEGGKRTGGLIGLLSLDPFSGLDPTTRAVHAARRSVERISYRGERMASVLRWQTELLIEESLDAPAMRRLRDDVTVLGQASSTVAATVSALPARITAERVAIVGALEANQGPLRSLVVETRASLDAGTGMAAALDRLVGSVDAFVARFDHPGVPPAPPSSAASARPFDITEYQRTAEAVGTAAERLDQLVRSAGELAGSPAIEYRLREVERAWDRTLQRGVLAVAGLILLAGGVALLVRRFGR